MKKIDNFLVLSRMCDKNDTSIKGYSGSTNFISADTGRDGWGEVRMAVDNATIMNEILNNKATIFLLIYDSNIFKQIKTEMEND